MKEAKYNYYGKQEKLFKSEGKYTQLTFEKDKSLGELNISSSISLNKEEDLGDDFDFEPLSDDERDFTLFEFDSSKYGLISDGEKEGIYEAYPSAFDFLSDEDKERFLELDISRVFKSFEDLMSGENTVEIFNFLEEFFEDFASFFKSDDKVEYHSFRNDIEEVIFNEFYETTREVRVIPRDYNFADIYYLYGELLYEHGKVAKAETIFKKALEYNPVSTLIINALIDVYEIKNDYETMFKLIVDGFKFAYTRMDISLLYTNLGVYYDEMGKYSMACTSFKYALKYYDNPELSSLIEFYNKNYEIEDMDIREIMVFENKIFIVNPFILTIFKGLGEFAESLDDIYNAILFNELYYDLTSDNEIKKKIYYLKNKS